MEGMVPTKVFQIFGGSAGAIVASCAMHLSCRSFGNLAFRWVSNFIQASCSTRPSEVLLIASSAGIARTCGFAISRRPRPVSSSLS